MYALEVTKLDSIKISKVLTLHRMVTANGSVVGMMKK